MNILQKYDYLHRKKLTEKFNYNSITMSLKI